MKTKENNDSLYKKFIKYLAGTFVLILGITLVLVWWDDVVGLFRGVTGMVLALAGMVFLYSLRNQ